MIKSFRNSVAAGVVAALALGVPTDGRAQGVPLQTAPRSFDIPPQSLTDALPAFGQQSGLQVSVDATLVRGAATNGVRGSLTAEQALTQLLAGTGFTYTIAGGNLVTLKRLPQSSDGGIIQLDPVEVEGARQRQTADGPVDGYLAQRTATATKTDTPVLETAQSISTITREQIDDQNPQTVSGALRYTAGVLSEVDSNSRYDTLFMRGFGGFGTSSTYVSFLDGLRLPRGQAFGNPAIDPYFLERIEVLRGPSGLLYGQISPGGLVNMVSRMPSTSRSGEAQLETGSYGRIQGAAYARGSFDSASKFQYGLGAIARSSGTRYDGVEERRIAVAPSLTWAPDTDTKLTLMGSYQDDPKGGYFNSIYPTFLAPASLSGLLGPKVNVGDPNYDHFKREQYSAGFRFERRFGDAVTLRSNFRYMHVDVDMQSLQMSTAPTAAGLLPRHAVGSQETVGGYAWDTNLQWKFATGLLQHTALAGIDWQYQTSSWKYLYGAAPALNLFNPQYGQVIAPLMTLMNTDQTNRQTGVYLQDQVALGGWRVSAGVRRDWVDQDSRDKLTGATSDQSSQGTSWRAGLLYLFEAGVAPYASYSTSFEPTVGTYAPARGGGQFEPTTGKQYEIGVKYQPPGSDLLVTLAGFDIRQQNVLTPDTQNPNFRIQQGEIRSRGIEVEARGRVTRNIDLIGAFTYLDTEVTRTTVPGALGKRPQAVPTNFGSLWGNYNFLDGLANGLGVGAGLRWVGATYADDANTVRTPGYTLVDLGLRYDLGRQIPQAAGAQVTLNVTNLVDKDYYASCSYNIYCQYGNGRTVLGGLRYQW
ncbi:MAG: TonB-dependent siderophore receptor [Ferrovibrionaceae bacterium]